MNQEFFCSVWLLRVLRVAGLLLIALLFMPAGLGTALADAGCDDVRQLCKEATAKALKCTKQEKDEAEACKPLTTVRDATCTQAEIVCKPPVGEPK
jgi:hypothetical protein